jgi:hypothetical protein
LIAEVTLSPILLIRHASHITPLMPRFQLMSFLADTPLPIEAAITPMIRRRQMIFIYYAADIAAFDYFRCQMMITPY